VLLMLLVVHSIVSLLWMPTLRNLSSHGNPGLWYPVAIYFLLACHTFRRILEPLQVRQGLGALALYLLICSAVLAVRLDQWWPAMALTSAVPVSFHVTYAYHFAFMGAFLAGLGYLSWRILPLYAATAILPLTVMPSGGPAAIAFVLGVSAYLYAEILYIMARTTEVPNILREHVE
jgi:hypothetical protein